VTLFVVDAIRSKLEAPPWVTFQWLARILPTSKHWRQSIWTWWAQKSARRRTATWAKSVSSAWAKN